MKRLLMVAALLMLALGIAAAHTPIRAQDPTPEATPIDPLAPLCDNSPASRLQTGGLAKVIAGNSQAAPGAFLTTNKSNPLQVIRYLSIGSVVELVEGPQCSAEGDRWWSVKLGDLAGWITETSGQTYILEPFEGTPPTPLPSTVLQVLKCIKPSSPADAPTPGMPVLRIAFGTVDGTLEYSDNGGTSRVIAQFEPPLLNVDLSPNGSEILVTNYNGVYWVDVLTGQTVLVADSSTIGLTEDSWPNRVFWLPDGRQAAIEVQDVADQIHTFPIWSLSLDGSQAPFRADLGEQPENSIRRSPLRNAALLLTANSISRFPKSMNDDPPAYLEFVPLTDEGDARDIFRPATTWNADNTGFYTYIPKSEFAPPEDPVGGHLWYIPLEGEPKDLGTPSNIGEGEYVIPSPNGEALLLGRGSRWRIQAPESGSILQTLPPIDSLFDWTPDGKGVVFTSEDRKPQYLGLDGSTTSDYVPVADNLFEIRWLPDGSVLYVVQGKDGRYTFSVRPPGKEANFMGIIPTPYAWSAAIYPGTPGLGKAPESCL